MAKQTRPRTAGSLYSHQAVDQFSRINEMFWQADADEVLKKAGLGRKDLKRVLSDDEIDQAVERRTENLIQSNYTLSPSEGAAAEIIYGMLDQHLENLLASSVRAKLYGYSVTEIVYAKGAQVLPAEVVEKPLDWFTPRQDGSVIFSQQNGQKSQIDLQYKFIVQRNQPTWDNPMGKAALSRVYWLWFFKSQSWQFWSKFLERFGSPLLHGSSHDPDALAAAMAAAHSSNSLAYGPDDEVAAIQATGDGKAFGAYQDAIGQRIAKYLLGQTLTSGADKGGTYGQGKVHQEQQELIFEADKRFAARAVQSLIDRVCALNGLEPIEFNWISESGLQDDRAKRDLVLTQQGVRFKPEYYIDTYDIDERYLDTAAPKGAVALGVSAERAAASFKAAAGVGLSAEQLSGVFKAAAAGSPAPFTPDQMRVESVADYALGAGSPISSEQIKQLVAEADTPEALTDSLYRLNLGLDHRELGDMAAALYELSLSSQMVGAGAVEAEAE